VDKFVLYRYVWGSYCRVNLAMSATSWLVRRVAPVSSWWWCRGVVRVRASSRMLFYRHLVSTAFVKMNFCCSLTLNSCLNVELKCFMRTWSIITFKFELCDVKLVRECCNSGLTFVRVFAVLVRSEFQWLNQEVTWQKLRITPFQVCYSRNYPLGDG